MAYSEIINTTAYKKLRARNAAVRIIIFTAVTGVIGAAAFISPYASNAVATVITAACAALTAYTTKIWLAFEKSWDGVVTAKEKRYTYSKTLKMLLADPRRGSARDKEGNVIPFVRSILRVRREDGVEIEYSDVEEDELPEVCYYRIGDKVRHHSGLRLYEKEDKSLDRAVLCLRCLKLTPKDADNCQHCGLPLLK